MKVIALLASVCLLSFGGFPASAAEKPNILFIAVDDLRPELGCYGKKHNHSPNIDRLARAGMVFDRAYCQQAICSPSRTSVLTGVRPDTSKVWDLVTSFRTTLPDVVTLGQQFMRNGYFVQGMGKIYHGNLNDTASWSVPWGTLKAPTYAQPEGAPLAGSNTTPSDEDRTDNTGADLKSYTLPSGTGKGGEKKFAKGEKGKSGNKAGKAPNSLGPVYEAADVPDNYFQDGKVADLAVKTLGELSKRSQPFFLAVGFCKPHLPWVAPKKYFDLYDPEKIALAPNPFTPKDAPAYAIGPLDGEIRGYKGVPPKGEIPPNLARKFRQAYFASVSYADANVGKVLNELDRLGLTKNTIIILWGDHGWNLGEHTAWGKHTNVENDVNAPLILSVPGMKNAGQHSRALVEFVDMYPTLCELAGIPLPSHLEGVSFKPLLADPNRPWKTAAFSQYPRGKSKNGQPLMGYTMRTDRYRFTVWVNNMDHAKVDAIELYDHQADPQENQNVANKPENANLVKKLTAEWKAGWQAAKPPGAP